MNVPYQRQLLDIEPDASMWSAQGALFYSLAIVSADALSGRFATQIGLGAAGLDDDVTREFAFPYVQSVDDSEPPATTLRFLLGNGVHLEHRGLRQKFVNVSGTTGLRPYSVPGTTIPVLGTRIPFSGGETGVTEERTGLTDLAELRNLFRAWFRIQTDVDKRRALRLVWLDAYLNDAWVVEVLKPGLRLDRVAGRPMTTAWSFSLVGIEQINAFVLPSEADSTKEGGFGGFLKRITDFTNTLRQGLADVSSLIERAAGVTQLTLNTFLGPASAVLDGLRGIVGGVQRFLTIPRNTVISIANDFIGFLNTIDTLANYQVNPFFAGGGLSEVRLLQSSGRAMVHTLRRIAAEPRLFGVDLPSALQNRAQRYARPDVADRGRGDMQRVPGANTGARQGVVFGGEDIYAAARRILGDARRWRELVVLNSLRPPYIAASGNGTDVLRPGDPILYPSRNDGIEVNTQVTDDTARIASRLGQDVRLLGTPGMATQASDFAIDSGDLALIHGQDNYGQALAMLFATPIGALPLHPTYGIPWVTGAKQRLTTVSEWNLRVRGALLSDPRTAKVDRFGVTYRGNAVHVSARVTSIDGDDGTARMWAIRR